MADRCECVRCDTCKGLGDIDDLMDYSGRYPYPCDDCEGSGITEMCDYCMDVMEIEQNERDVAQLTS